eukprot:m.252575 g.252575  ORF g.252575 m.252575 type:complete len:81 (-) comp19568_c0_seq1:1123-1365(-)
MSIVCTPAPSHSGGSFVEHDAGTSNLLAGGLWSDGEVAPPAHTSHYIPTHHTLTHLTPYPHAVTNVLGATRADTNTHCAG